MTDFNQYSEREQQFIKRLKDSLNEEAPPEWSDMGFALALVQDTRQQRPNKGPLIRWFTNLPKFHFGLLLKDGLNEYFGGIR